MNEFERGAACRMSTPAAWPAMCTQAKCRAASAASARAAPRCSTRVRRRAPTHRREPAHREERRKWEQPPVKAASLQQRQHVRQQELSSPTDGRATRDGENGHECPRRNASSGREHGLESIQIGTCGERRNCDLFIGTRALRKRVSCANNRRIRCFARLSAAPQSGTCTIAGQ